MDTEKGSRLTPQLSLFCPSPEPWGTERDPFPSDHNPPLTNSTLSSSISSVDWELDEDTESNAISPGENFLSAQAMEGGRPTYQRCEECDHEDSCFIKSRIGGDYLSMGKMCQCCRRRGRSRSQTCTTPSYNKEISAGFLEAPQSSLRSRRRARSLDGRASDSTTTPDLLNFKKGWLLTLDDQEQWRKYWFVLSAQSLRFYLDSGAEEASELVGEIDLTTCRKVTEHLVQRNYGFQLHTPKLVYTLAAVTAGIRQNWIQALTKNMQSHNAPDVTSLADNHLLQVKAQFGPDVTQDSRCCPEQRPNHNRRHGRGSETLDWDEFSQGLHMMAQKESREQEWLHLQTEKEQEEQESRSRRRGREERRQRYAFVMGSSAYPGEDEEKSSQAQQQQQQQQRISEIEECWLQVERTAIRDGRKVPLYPECQSKSSAELEKILEHYQRKVEQLTVQLTKLADGNQSLEREDNTDWIWQQEPTRDTGIPCKAQQTGPNKPNPVLTLTDKYQETKQLLQLENLRRQRIKNRLNLCPLPQINSEFLTEPELKTVCNVLCCETMNNSSLGSHDWCEASRDWEDEHSRAKVDGFSERAVLPLRKNVGSDPTMVERFSQEDEFLARQHEALDRHNQELLNQLAEANREIDRLKAELLHQPNGCQPDLASVVERLEMELARNCRALQEAQNQLAEMEENLKDTHATLQLREATLQSLGFLTKDSDEKIGKVSCPDEMNRLCQCVQVLESKVSELESQLSLSEQTCRKLQNQNAPLRESELVNSLRVTEAEGNVEKLQREPDTSSQWTRLMHVNRRQVQDGRRSREGIQHVVEESVQLRSSELNMLLEVIKPLAENEEQVSALEHENTQVNCTVVQSLQLEKNIWESFLNALKDHLSQGTQGTEGAGSLLQCAKKKLEEITMDLLALSISTGSSSPNFDITGLYNGMEKDQQNIKTVLTDERLGNGQIWRGLKQLVETRLTLLNHEASKLESSINSERHCDVWNQTDDFHLHPFVSAAMDLFIACLVGYRNALQERTWPVAKLFYSNIKDVEIQAALREGALYPNNMVAHEKSEVSEENETETASSLRCRIKELEHLLSNGAMTLASLQRQHDEDKASLKAAYEQGFTLLKESHQKFTEDLLLKHQQDQERLQEENERLLAEEAAATLTVIEAMKRAHSSEMERVLQKANWEKSSGDTSIAEILKNHSEELESVQRELDALSKQYSQKCLESVHLTQALEAERKALQHCQHQNLALGTSNQELYNHLAEEIIRLSVKANDGSSELVDGRQRYELEIMLRVKESEVEYLKQEISTLKTELDTSLMGQKLATERHQELQTDFSMAKEKAEQQIEQLREHLRLVYKALAESVEKRTCTTVLTAARHTLLKS
ncbi:uncharacterized protein [Salminus brasiliensis]|uniref:uncharacterized protein isoform X3 n=1 Tax=Salminus brasiliensis TaxID=930266 RepID=UPI003B838CD9